MIKTFANLLFALFSSARPYYLQVKKILAALHYYKIPTLRALVRYTRASILWILLLQACHFLAGNITELVEFKTTMNKLTSKDGHISHVKVPSQLLYDPKKRPPPASQDLCPSAQIPRLAHEPDPSPAVTRVHSLLKKKIVDNIIRVSDGVSLTAICKFINTEVKALCPEKKTRARDGGNVQESKLHQKSHHGNQSRSHTRCEPAGKGY